LVALSNSVFLTLLDFLLQPARLLVVQWFDLSSLFSLSLPSPYSLLTLRIPFSSPVLFAAKHSWDQRWVLRAFLLKCISRCVLQYRIGCFFGKHFENRGGTILCLNSITITSNDGVHIFHFI